MIVNIGAETTEISVLSLGGIVISKSVKIGGNKLDDSIISAVRKVYNLIIGSKTAEGLKNSAVPYRQKKLLRRALDVAMLRTACQRRYFI